VARRDRTDGRLSEPAIGQRHQREAKGAIAVAAHKIARLSKFPHPISRPPADPALQDRHFYFGKLLCRIFCREQPAIASVTLNFFDEPEAALTTQLKFLVLSSGLQQPELSIQRIGARNVSLAASRFAAATVQAQEFLP
jgi:hypothetical protein